MNDEGKMKVYLIKKKIAPPLFHGPEYRKGIEGVL